MGAGRGCCPCPPGGEGGSGRWVPCPHPLPAEQPAVLGHGEHGVVMLHEACQGGTAEQLCRASRGRKAEKSCFQDKQILLFLLLLFLGEDAGRVPQAWGTGCTAGRPMAWHRAQHSPASGTPGWAGLEGRRHRQHSPRCPGVASDSRPRWHRRGFPPPQGGAAVPAMSQVTTPLCGICLTVTRISPTLHAPGRLGQGRWR